MYSQRRGSSLRKILLSWRLVVVQLYKSPFPLQFKDPGSFIIIVIIGESPVRKALLDWGPASI